MADNSDKTVFQSNSGGGDFTVMKPMPGGRSAPSGGEPFAQPNTSYQSAPPPAQPPRVDHQISFQREGQGLNPVVNAGTALLAVFRQTRGSASHKDIPGLHRRIVAEIKEFEARLRALELPQSSVISARYVMCAVLDESVLNTPWGSDSAWGQHTLLSVFHNETSGGEKFFLILKHLSATPAENRYVLELMYLCLSLGFEGKYRAQARGRDALEQLRDELFTLIRRYRGEYERNLADQWQGLGRSRKTLEEYIPMWLVGVVAVSVIFFSFSGFRWWLYELATPVEANYIELTEPVYERIEEKEALLEQALKENFGSSTEEN